MKQKNDARFVWFIALFLVTCIAPSIGHAQVLGLFSGSPRTDGGKVVGISLNSFGVTLNSLGVYDSGDGLSTSYQVGLWDASQTLLASATVTPSSPLIGDCRYASIPSITIGSFLSPQTFTIGVLLPPVMNDVWLDNALTIPAVSLTGGATGQFVSSPTLQYPGTFDTGPYYVVNAGPVVPEPTGLSLIGAALAMLRRGRIGERCSSSAGLLNVHPEVD